MAEVKLFGYCNRISVKPDDQISFHVTADGTKIAEAQLVRLIHGDHNPDGPGYIEQELPASVNGTWSVKKQFTQVGSYLQVPDAMGRLALDGSFTLYAFVCPTLFGQGRRQAILGRWSIHRNEGYCLGINQQGLLEFWVGDGKEVDNLTAEVPLDARVWYLVAASYDAATGRATLFQGNVLNRYNSILGKVVLEPEAYDSHVQETLRFRPRNTPETPFLIGGAVDWHELRGNFIAQNYNGKVDRPGVIARALTRADLEAIRGGQLPPSADCVAYWDTTKGYGDHGIGDIVYDVGPNGLNAMGINRPVRCQTGWNWSGRNDCFRLAPGEYGGVEFHDDAMIDCRWDATKTWTIPSDLKSGPYAVRLRAGDGHALGEEYLVFFVRAAVPKAPICFLVPTASYLAYANERLSFDAQIVKPITGQTPIVSAVDIEMYQSREFGLSTYDTHADGAGVCYSSYLRPVINMRPKYRISSMGIPWQLPADLSVLAWLDRMNYDWELITDEDLDRDGLEALKPFKCVLTGTHPEYYSERMLDATEDYLAGGGRLIYMGGNGYYWNVAFRPDEPWCMEVRKLDSGMRAWNARPGEHYLQTTGQKSGLWKNLGRAPQKTVGVGFISQGFEVSTPYRRMPDSWHRTVNWMFEGIEGEIIGERGLAHGGAAGIEIDRYDLSLGTPPHAKIIASSGGHPDNYMLVCEEILYAHPGMTGTYDYRIRADMVYFTTPKNGAVFSTGSIAFGQSLPCEDFASNASRLLKNIVDAFSKEGRLPGSAWMSEEKQWQ
jgi:N,N-dimethylformamidase